jgi:hypothetical protein
VSIAAIILSIAKAIPAAERVLEQVIHLYSAWKTQQNLTDEKAKNARNNDAVDSARRTGTNSERVLLCPTCPYSNHAGGQHIASDNASAVSRGGIGGP